MITLKKYTTERYSLGQKTVQIADQSYRLITISHIPVSLSFDQVKINKITNW